MRLARYRHLEQESWGVVDTVDSTIRRVRGPFEQWAPAVTMGGSSAIEYDGAPVALTKVELLAPLVPTSEIVGVTNNYVSGVVPPKGSATPVYVKPHNCFVDPDGVVEYPGLITIQPQCRFAYEIHLAAVIGNTRVGEEDPLSDVLGYTIANDGTLNWCRPSFMGSDLFGAKSAYRSSVIGPWIVTRDEFDDSAGHSLTTKVNGYVVQEGTTKDMYLSLQDTIGEANHRVVLTTGDVVLTGTPGYLSPYDGTYFAADSIELEIDGIGVLRNRIQDTDNYPVHVSQRWDGAKAVMGVVPPPGVVAR